MTKKPQHIVDTIRSVRRRGILNEFVSVSTNSLLRSVHIASDGGRLCRPYIIVTHSQPHVTQEHINVFNIYLSLYVNFLLEELYFIILL